MNLVVRRRLAVGAIAASSALVAGLLLAPPSSARANGLFITPSGAVNSEKAAVLTFQGTDADFEFGGTATFNRVGGSQPFTATLDSDLPPTGTQRKQKATEDFTDEGDGVGIDGPADAGVYNVSATGAGDPITGSTAIAGGGTDTCFSCFTVLSPGPVTVSSSSPTSLRPGNTGTNISITGNNFERGSAIAFLYSDGTVDPFITATAPPQDSTGKDIIKGITTRTQLQRRARVDAADAPGARGVRVTNLDGNAASCTGCFFVAGPALTGLSPTSGLNDPGRSPVVVTFTGSNVVDGEPRLEFLGNPGSSTRTDLSLVGVKTGPSTGTSMTALFDLQNAGPGPYQGVIRDSSTGITNACEQPACPQFTVIQSNRVPTVTGLDRDPNVTGNQKDQQAGTTQVFDVAGTNFSKGVLIKVLNTGTTTATTGITVTALEFVSPTLVRATIVADKAAAPGDYDVTATLTDGTVSPACSKCYTVTAAQSTASPTPSSTASPTASSTASACPTASSSSATPTATVSPSRSASPSATGTPTATASATGTPTATASATGSPTGTASSTPRASGCPSPTPTRVPATLTVNTPDISAGANGTLTGTGSANQQYQLQCYTRPSTSYFTARSGSFSAAGDPVTFTLSLGRNTRCFLQYATNSASGASPSGVINVHTVLSLSTVRTGVRTYIFQGRNLPRIAGQLITLYRVDAAGNEIRTSNLVTDDSGIYRVSRKFTGTGTFRFKVRTSQTLNNAAGVSNTISVAVR